MILCNFPELATRLRNLLMDRFKDEHLVFRGVLQSIAERGRALIDRRKSRYDDAAQRSETLIELCEQLLSGRGEASGVALAREVLGRYEKLTTGPRIAFFEALTKRFGVDAARIEEAAGVAGRASGCNRRGPA